MFTPSIIILHVLITGNLPVDNCVLLFFMPTWYMIHIFTHFAFFSLATVIMYSIISCIAYSKVRKLATGVESSRADQLRGTWKIMKMLGLVLGIYFALYLPLMTAVIGMTSNAFMKKWQWPFFMALWFVNSWINPVIYALQSKPFRQAFKKLLCRNRASVDPMP